MQVVDRDNGDVVDPARKNGIAIFQIAGQVVERAGRGKSTGTAKRTTRLPLKSSSVVTSTGPSAVFSLKVALGSLSPTAMVTGLSSSLYSSGVSQDYRVGSIKGKHRFHAAAARAQGERDRLTRDVLVLAGELHRNVGPTLGALRIVKNRLAEKDAGRPGEKEIG